RIDLVHDVELELHRCPVGQYARDAAVVLVAHDDGGHRLRDVVRAVVEGDDLAVLARGVVDAHPGAVGDEKGVDLLVDLTCGHRGRRLVAAAATATATELSGVRVTGIVLLAHLVVGAALGGRIDVHRHER